METLTPKEVAKILKLHPFSVTRLARQKKLPAFKVGGSWRFQKDQFEDWIERMIRGQDVPEKPSKQKGNRNGSRK